MPLPSIKILNCSTFLFTKIHARISISLIWNNLRFLHQSNQKFFFNSDFAYLPHHLDYLLLECHHMKKMKRMTTRKMMYRKKEKYSKRIWYYHHFDSYFYLIFFFCKKHLHLNYLVLQYNFITLYVLTSLISFSSLSYHFSDNSFQQLESVNITASYS